jgi:hypothetical protein
MIVTLAGTWSIGFISPAACSLYIFLNTADLTTLDSIILYTYSHTGYKKADYPETAKRVKNE